MAISVPGWFCLMLAVWAALAPVTSHAALVAQWVAEDWAGGTSPWVDRVGGRIATVPTLANSPAKTQDLFPLRGTNLASGLVFDGVDDYLFVARAQNPIAGKTSVTIVAFFLTTQGASGPDGFFYHFPGPLNGESSGTPNDWGLTYDAAGIARGFFNYPTIDTPALTVSLIDGRPHSMILTWQDPSVFPGQGVARLYVDGVLVGTPTLPYDGGDGIVNDHFVIGSEPQFLARYFSGAIGELRFYDSVEDPAAVNAELQVLIDVLVSSSQDGGPGTLRQAVAGASATATITFDPALSGQLIILTNGPILINGSLTIDASALPGGIIINGNSASRVFEIAGNATVVLNSLTITGGKTADGASGTNGTDGGSTQPGGHGGNGDGAASGGGIFNRGTLTLDRVTLSGNSTGKGGKGGDGGPGVVQGVGGSGGSGGSGGAIYNAGTGILTILNSTIANNNSGSGANAGSGNTRGDGGHGGSGGGIANDGALNIIHTTITGNGCGVGGSGEFGQAPAGAGGGIRTTGSLNLTNSLVALNTAPGGGPDLSGSATAIGGVNFIGNPSGASGLGALGVDYLTGDPMVATLGFFGGPTHTQPPLPGSPVLNAAIPVAGVTTDQRGVPRMMGDWINDFSSDLGGATVLTSGGNPATGIRDAGSFLLTPEVANQAASLVLPDLGAFSGFSAGFDVYFSDGSDPAGPAEGFSFSFGPAPGTAVGEEGIAGGHVVSMDTYDAGTSNGYIRYVRTTGNPTNINGNFSFNRFNDANKWHHIDVTLQDRGRLTVRADGSTFLAAIDTGYTYAPGDRFTVGARTGSYDSEQRVDNLDVQVSSVDIGAVEGTFVPAGPVRLDSLTLLGKEAVQLTFTNLSGAIFAVLTSTNVARPFYAWSSLGFAMESPSGSGHFRFTDSQATNFPQRFYRATSP